VPAHEHIYTNGDICLSLLGSGWRPNLTGQGIALAIQSMMMSAAKKSLPRDNAAHAGRRPGQEQTAWIYHDDSC
jgi:ubiquitin-conjugating enzyme E2 W